LFTHFGYLSAFRTKSALWFRVMFRCFSQVRTLPNHFLIDVILGVGEFLDSLVNDMLELAFPHIVQFF